LEGKLRQGVITAAGTAVVETIYCLLAFFGMSFFKIFTPLIDILFIIGALTIIVVGIHLYLNKIQHDTPPPTYPMLIQLGEFFIGFFVTAINPGVILSWIFILALLTEAGIIFSSPLDVMFSIGVGVGSVIWFYIYLKLLIKIRSSLNPLILERFIKFFSIVIIIIGIYLICSRYELFINFFS
jgi:threonine/homoserine/homoserine lactone efflux protein